MVAYPDLSHFGWVVFDRLLSLSVSYLLTCKVGKMNSTYLIIFLRDSNCKVLSTGPGKY